MAQDEELDTESSVFVVNCLLLGHYLFHVARSYS